MAAQLGATALGVQPDGGREEWCAGLVRRQLGGGLLDRALLDGQHSPWATIAHGPESADG